LRRSNLASRTHRATRRFLTNGRSFLPSGTSLNGRIEAVGTPRFCQSVVSFAPGCLISASQKILVNQTVKKNDTPVRLSFPFGL